MPMASLTWAALLLTEGRRRSLCLWGLGAPGRCLLARHTDPHLPTPRRRLHQDRWRIEAVLANMPDEPHAGALVLYRAPGYALVEDGGQSLAEGRYHRGRTPTRCHAVMSRHVSAVHASFPVFHPVLRPLLGTVPLSPHATCSSRALGPCSSICVAIIP